MSFNCLFYPFLFLCNDRVFSELPHGNSAPGHFFKPPLQLDKAIMLRSCMQMKSHAAASNNTLYILPLSPVAASRSMNRNSEKAGSHLVTLVGPPEQLVRWRCCP